MIYRAELPWWRKVLVRLAGWTPPELPRTPKATSNATWHERIVGRTKETKGPVYLGTADVWAVASSSDPMEVHYVLAVPGEGLVCGCRGFRYKGKCHHRLSVALDIGE